MTSRPRWLVVGCLGTAQSLAWGMSYYLIAVLASPINADTGWGLLAGGAMLLLGCVGRRA